MPMNSQFGQLKDGRGNICPVTIILPTIAMMVKETGEKYGYISGDNGEEVLIDAFIDYLDDKIHEAKDMLIERFKYISSQPAESAKFMYENNVMKGYDGKDIVSALKHGTLAIGQLGLAETLQILVGCDQTEKRGMKVAKRIEQLFKDRCAEFKKEYKLNFGVYYTPAENLCFTAMTRFKEKYGEIPNVSDKKFFTNSIHVPVWKEIDPFEKIDIESQLTGYSSAGCITYVEINAGIKNNLEALEQIVNYMQKEFCGSFYHPKYKDVGWEHPLDDTWQTDISYNPKSYRFRFKDMGKYYWFAESCISYNGNKYWDIISSKNISKRFIKSNLDYQNEYSMLYEKMTKLESFSPIEYLDSKLIYIPFDVFERQCKKIQDNKFYYSFTNIKSNYPQNDLTLSSAKSLKLRVFDTEEEAEKNKDIMIWRSELRNPFDR